MCAGQWREWFSAQICPDRKNCRCDPAGKTGTRSAFETAATRGGSSGSKNDEAVFLDGAVAAVDFAASEFCRGIR